MRTRPAMKDVFYKIRGKRLLDLSLGISLAGVLAPVLAAVAFLVRVTLGRPIFFRQERPGFQGKPFLIYKFRTMTEDRDACGDLLPDAQRLGKLGRFLRMTSLDELPELFNVLKGEMSLVGPRPLLMQYVGRYTPEQARRHEVRPGITGWAQIHGRNTAFLSRRLAMDVWYVDHCSPWLDLRILLLTALKVLRSEGVIPDQDVSEIDDCGLYRKTTWNR
jgi:sugar transferase EpsL